MKKTVAGILAAVSLTLAGCAFAGQGTDMEALVKAAKEEGRCDSVGMPYSWANWEDTWKDLERIYGLQHMDTDMSSAEEVAKMKAEKDNATADIGDVGIEFGDIAKAMGVTQPYKPATWDQIPVWAKDEDGHWVLGYTGTIAFIVNKDLVKDIPHSWEELLHSDAKVSIGGVGQATQANSAMLACSFARGGDETNLQPAIEYFQEIAKQGRLALNNPGDIAAIEKGEIEVGFLWDFNALNYRDQIDHERFEVLIPSDGSVISGYCTIINKYGKHPNAAKLAREYILSDAGQINLARGYAKPIRKVELPSDVAAKLIPDEQYSKVFPIKDYEAWKVTAQDIPMLWQEQVLLHRK